MYTKPQTLEKIKKICDKHNFIFQDISYKGRYSYISYLDDNGNLNLKRRDHFFEQFGIEYIERHGSKYTTEILQQDPRIKPTVKIISEFENINTKVLCKCIKCGNEWWITPNKLIQGRACPNCKSDVAKEKFTKTNEAFRQELINKEIPYINCEPYINAKTPIAFRCLNCGYTFKAAPTNIVRKVTGCTKCAASLGEYKIIKSLQELNIPFKTQKTFKGCVYKGQLRFDFYLPNYQTCIEFHGEQHYKPIAFHKEEYGHEKDNLKEQHKRDEKKQQYCEEHNIKLIIIPYTEREKISSTYILNLLSK